MDEIIEMAYKDVIFPRQNESQPNEDIKISIYPVIIVLHMRQNLEGVLNGWKLLWDEGQVTAVHGILDLGGKRAPVVGLLQRSDCRLKEKFKSC